MFVKILSISPIRQVTIPQIFYKQLCLGKHAECFIRDNSLIIRPIPDRHSADLAQQVPEKSKEPVAQFKETSERFRPAMLLIFDEASHIAKGDLKGYSMADIFGPKYHYV